MSALQTVISVLLWPTTLALIASSIGLPAHLVNPRPCFGCEIASTAGLLAAIVGAVLRGPEGHARVAQIVVESFGPALSLICDTVKERLR